MDISIEIKQFLAQIIQKEYFITLKPEEIHLERPNNEVYGDFASNVSLMLAKEVKQSPLDIAKKVSYELANLAPKAGIGDLEVEMFEKADFAPPGFINITISRVLLLQQALEITHIPQNQPPKHSTGYLRGQNVLHEYTDPNPFKVFHIGHLMSNAIGESLSRLAEFNGANVKRANYQGDVGLHIAKSIWGAFKKFKDESMTLEQLGQKSLSDRIKFLGDGYSLGATAFEEDKDAQAQIKKLNTQVYLAAQKRLVEEEGWEPVIDYEALFTGEPPFPQNEVDELYKKGREWSLEDFETLYDKLGTKFDYYFFESKVGEYGLKLVQENLKKGVFEEDQGAVIFRGDDIGLHTRVFINSFGLPLYEAKDLALVFMKNNEFNYDLSYIITANEIDEYFKVVLAALNKINPDLAQKTNHIGHGVMKFKHGKMSSRTGDVVTGVTLLEDAKLAVLAQMQLSNTDLSQDQKEGVAEKLGIGAVKYSILKHGTNRDTVYDKEQAILVTGDTGPYLQYTHARANSILEKSGLEKGEFEENSEFHEDLELDEKELSVLRHLMHFEETAQRASKELSPSTVCSYLFELAQRYNALYNDLPILNEQDEILRTLRLQITAKVKETLRVGLWLLGIDAPERV